MITLLIAISITHGEEKLNRLRQRHCLVSRQIQCLETNERGNLRAMICGGVSGDITHSGRQPKVEVASLVAKQRKLERRIDPLADELNYTNRVMA